MKRLLGLLVAMSLFLVALCYAIPALANLDYQFVLKWGSYGTGDGQFSFPYGVAVDGSGNVYVADTDNNRIQKFTSDGSFITKWDFGTGDGQFSSPYGVAVDGSGNVYVTDLYNSRILKFTGDGSFITKWGSYGTGDGQFSFPCEVAVDSSGNVYVADTDNNRIQKFTSDGSFITKWDFGTGDGQFSSPYGVAVDGSGNVYVTDLYNSRILKFALLLVPATVDIDLDTLNLKGKGNWVTAYIELLAGYDAAHIDLSTVRLQGEIPAVTDPKYDFVSDSSEYLVDHDGDGALERMVKFPHAEVASGLSPGDVTLTVTGEVNGTLFEGSDTIRVK
jgi:hypothetical protein